MRTKLYFLLCCFLYWNSLLNAQIQFQGFEATLNDGWSTTLSTPLCTVGGDVWNIVNSLGSGTAEISPSSGSQFFGFQDLNGDCGGSSFETLTFADTDISTFGDVTFQFDYNVFGFDSSDDIKYEMFYDNVSQGEVVVVDGFSNFSTNGWETEMVTIPAAVNLVSVIISVRQNGGGDYGGIDNVQLIDPSTLSTSVEFAQTTASVDETAGAVDMTVCASIANPDATNATTVEVSVDAGSTATETSDYTLSGPQPITLTFPAGSSDDQCVTVTIVDDADIESDETVIFNLANVMGGNSAALGTNTQFTLTIEDDDTPLPSLVISEIMYDTDGTDDEWIEVCNTGSTDIDLIGYDVLRTNDNSTRTISNSIVIIGNSCITIALGNSNDATFNPGCPFTPDVDISGNVSNFLSNATRTIQLRDDSDVIIDEVLYTDANPADISFILTDLSADNSDTGNGNWIASSNDGGSPGVAGNLGCPTADTEISFAQTEATVAENDISPQTMIICVDIANPSVSAATTADIVLSGGSTATYTSDFTLDNPPASEPVTISITFPAASTDQICIDLNLVDDMMAENSETFTVGLTNVAGGKNATATSGGDLLTVTIQDDDTPPVTGVLIQEILHAPPTSADYEYFELVGDPNQSLDGVTLLFVESDVQTSTGQIDQVIPLDGLSLGTNGLLLYSGSNALMPAPDAGTTVINSPGFFIESPSYTAILVTGFSGSQGDDLDTDNDGVLNSMPWLTVLDAIGIPDAVGEPVYGAEAGGIDLTHNGVEEPDAVVRNDNGDWLAVTISEEAAGGPYNFINAYDDAGAAVTVANLVPDNLTPGGATQPALDLTTRVEFTAAAATVSETDGSLSATVCVAITNPDAVNATTVDVTIGGDAADPADYTLTYAGNTVTSPFTITFAAGAATDECITVNLVDDGDIEPTETITFTLSNPMGGNSASLGDDTDFTLSILDDDTPLPLLVISEIMYNTPGTDDEWIEICNNDMTDFDLNGYDITGSGGTKTFSGSTVVAAGTCITVALGDNNDAAFNPDCPFTPDVDLSDGVTDFLGNTSGTIQLLNTTDILIDEVMYDDGDASATDGNGPSYVLTDLSADNSNTNNGNWIASINDGGSPGVAGDAGCPGVATVVGFRTLSASVDEDAGTLTMTVCAQITAPSGIEATSVMLEVDAASTATETDDFTITSNTLTFAAGETNDVCAEITITDDATFEEDETIVLNLVTPMGGNSAEVDMMNNQFTLTINANDRPVVEFTETTYQICETDGTIDMTVCASISNPASVPTTVDVILDEVNSTATNGTDIATYTTQTLTFPANDASDQCISFTVNTDSDDTEGEETLIFDLANAMTGTQTATIGTNANTTVSITDASAATAPMGVYLNEILFNPPSTDDPNEYIEIRGGANQTLPNGTYLVFIEGDEGSAGAVQTIFDLGNVTLGSNGYLVLTQSSSTYTVDPDATVLSGAGVGFAGLPGYSSTGTDLENASFTAFLIFNVCGAPQLTDDIDVEDDGVPEGVFDDWTILDGISVLDDDDAIETAYADLVFAENPTGGQTLYTPMGATIISTEDTEVAYVARIGDSTGDTGSDWFAALVDGTAPTFTTVPNRTYSGTYGGNALDNIGSTNAFTALSVDLVAFGATLSGQKVLLKWEVASETQNAEYTIERSTDGRTFQTIGQVVGAGSSERNITYTFQDVSPAEGLNFYQLRQRDLHGKTTLYGPVSVLVEGNETTTLYPQPATDVLFVSVPTNADRTTLTLTTPTGKQLRRWVSTDTLIEMEVADLPAGVYFLNVVQRGRMQTFNVVKQ